MLNLKLTERFTPALSETLFALLETLPGALFVVDNVDTIVYANASAQTITGASQEELSGKFLWSSAPQLVSTALYQAVQQTRQRRAPSEVEYVSPVTRTRLHVQLVPTVGGLIVHVHQGRAATGREAPVLQGKRFSIDDLGGLNSGIIVLTPEGNVLEINEVLLADAQIRREEVIGQPLAETSWGSYSPTKQAQLRAAIARASRGEAVRFETVMRPREGVERHLDVAISPHRDADHHIAYLVCVGIDITARKRAEAEIHALIDTIPQMVWTGSPDGSCTYVNRRWCDYTGLSTEEVQQDGWRHCIHPEDRQRVHSEWLRAVQTGGMYEVEHRLRHGTTRAYRWFLTRGMPVRDESGQIINWFGTTTDIDGQKRAEEQLKASRESLRELNGTLPQLVWVIRPDGRHEYVNQRWCDYFGLTLEHVQSDPWAYRQFVHPEDRERDLASAQHALDTGTMFEHEERLRNSQTGEYRWFLVRAWPMRDETGQIVRWFGTSTDIEEQKRAEQQLKESRESLRELNGTLPQLVWVIRPDGRHEYVNQRWCDYFGLTLEHVQSDPWAYRQFVHPEDRERDLASAQHALDTGTMFEHEERLRNSQTGEYRWFLVRAWPMRDEAGQIVRWFGTSTDIEEQKRAEQQLKESRESWRMLAETVPQLVWVIRPDGCHEYVNQRWCDYTGLTLEQVQGTPRAEFQFIHPDDQKGNRACTQHAVETGEGFEHEERLRNGQTGEYRWFLVRGMPMRDEAGQIVKWFGTCTDIDEQKRIEEALRQSQERANVLMNSSIIGIFIAQDEKIIEANDTFLRMTGYNQENLREGRLNWMHMTPPEYQARTQQARQGLALHQSLIPYEKEYLCQDGSRLPVLVGGVVLPSDPSHIICFVLDNSARKELEQRKDDFISMASHELRNPLTALKLQTTLLHRKLVKQGTLDHVQALTRMEDQIKTTIRLVEELLDVSKMQAGRLEYVQEMVDLDALLREIVETMQQTRPSHTLVVRGTVGTSLIGDRDRLGQVFTNLLSNAIKYSPGAETVEMDLCASEEAVIIRVQDHGLGIPREQRDKIFERFYRVTGSKKRTIPGLGMGLYIVSEIVKHHEGTITVESEVGNGSTFTVTLPKKRTA